MNLAEIIKKGRSILGLKRGEICVINYIIKKRRVMVKDIAKGINRSDRIVREYLKHLYSLGLIVREIIVTDNKKLAYVYEISPRIKEVLREKFSEIIGALS